jgi:hypothetical protein
LKPVVGFAAGDPASKLVNLEGSHPDQLLGVLVAEQSLAKFF